MKRILLFLLPLALLSLPMTAQETGKNGRRAGHTDQNKFRQMKDVLPTPNETRTASGKPGYQYTQQKVDYVMDIKLDEATNRIYGMKKLLITIILKIIWSIYGYS